MRLFLRCVVISMDERDARADGLNFPSSYDMATTSALGGGDAQIPPAHPPSLDSTFGSVLICAMLGCV